MTILDRYVYHAHEYRWRSRWFFQGSHCKECFRDASFGWFKGMRRLR